METQEGWNIWLAVVRDIFLHLIKVMIAPLIFASVVQGFAGTGDMKKAQRIGWKSLLYFEIVTTLALVVGLAAVNLLKQAVVRIWLISKKANWPFSPLICRLRYRKPKCRLKLRRPLPLRALPVRKTWAR